jgi:nicotinamide N-methyltransferase
MSHQHCPLVASLCLFLERSLSSRIFVVAGIHTGRPVLASFFRVASSAGLVPDADGISEYNIITGVQRPWMEDRGSEDSVERKQWLIVAKLGWSKNHETRT